jgi:hypothetical protein
MRVRSDIPLAVQIYHNSFDFLREILYAMIVRNEVEDLLHEFVKACPFIRLTEDVKIDMFMGRIDQLLQ